MLPAWAFGTGSAFFLAALNAWAVVTGTATAAGDEGFVAAFTGLLWLAGGLLLAWLGWVHWRRPVRRDPSDPPPPDAPPPAAAGSAERARRDAERTAWRSRRMP